MAASRRKTMARHFPLVTLVCAAAASAGFAQSIQLDPSSITNAATYIQPNYPNGGVAHGGMFVVRAKAGSGAMGACGTTVANGFPIGTNMNGTSMKITMAGASYDVDRKSTRLNSSHRCIS